MDTLSLQSVTGHQNYLLAKAEYLREQRVGAIQQQAEQPIALPAVSKPVESENSPAHRIDVAA